LKAYLRRAVIGATALFLFMALVTPAISGSDTVPASSSCYISAPSMTSEPNPVTTIQSPDANREPQLIEPTVEPEEQDDTEAREEESEPNNEPASISPDMPLEDKDPSSPEIAYPKFNNGKSNPNGQGYLRNLLRKTW
jgi:hypothetical protein